MGTRQYLYGLLPIKVRSSQNSSNFGACQYNLSFSEYSGLKLKDHEFIGVSAKEASLLPFLYKDLDLSDVNFTAHQFYTKTGL